MEKADILELTVQHLQLIHNTQKGIPVNYIDSSSEDEITLEPAKNNLNQADDAVMLAEEYHNNHECTPTQNMMNNQDQKEDLILVIKSSSIEFLQNQLNSNGYIFKSRKNGEILFLEPSNFSNNNNEILGTKQGCNVWRPW